MADDASEFALKAFSLTDVSVRTGQVPIMRKPAFTKKVVQPLPLFVLFVLRGELVGTFRGIVNHAGEDDCAACGERARCPPLMQCTWMPLTTRNLFTDRFGVDFVEGQVNFDELAAVWGVCQFILVLC